MRYACTAHGAAVCTHAGLGEHYMTLCNFPIDGNPHKLTLYRTLTMMISVIVYNLTRTNTPAWCTLPPASTSSIECAWGVLIKPLINHVQPDWSRKSSFKVIHIHVIFSMYTNLYCSCSCATVEYTLCKYQTRRTVCIHTTLDLMTLVSVFSWSSPFVPWALHHHWLIRGCVLKLGSPLSHPLDLTQHGHDGSLCRHHRYVHVDDDVYELFAFVDCTSSAPHSTSACSILVHDCDTHDFSERWARL